MLKHTRSFWTLVTGFLLVTVSHAGVDISEFMADNDTTLVTAEGLYEDWIEIHNDSGAAVDLAGWYLTDDPADLRKWQFPSTPATSTLANDGYLIVFADNSVDALISNELHASFKLGSGGEFLALIEPDGETVAYQYNPEFPAQSADISYGIDSGAGAHAYFDSPTPGVANGQAISAAVQFSVGSRTFASSFNLVLSVPFPGATTIRYTLDGSVPTSSSTLYGSPILISTTTQVRARSFESGLVDGPVVSETYYHLDGAAAAFSSEIPLVVIDNFGAGEIPDPTSATRQSSQVMIFEPVGGACTLTNQPVIASRAGIRRRGESSLRATADKPNLSLETWGEIDEESRSIKPFGFPAESDWILFAPLRFDPALMRNSFIYEVSNQAGRYAVRTRLVEVFLNVDGGSITTSNYYGVYVFMERIKQDPGRVDVADLPDTAAVEPEISGGYLWKLDKTDGGTQKFTVDGKTLTGVYPDVMPSAQINWLKDHLEQAVAATSNGTYGSFIDVKSFADHHIFTVFANNADGLIFSTFYHKDRGGLVQMGPLWDFDRSMGCETDPTDRPTDPEVWSHFGDIDNNLQFFRRPDRILFFPSLAQDDPDFWMVWTDQWHRMRKGPLSEAAMLERIERYRSELVNAAIRNFDRWDHLTQHLVISSPEWPGKVDLFKNHVLTRGQWIDDQLIDPPVFNHPGGVVSNGFQLTVSGPETQYFTLDYSDPRAVGGAAAGTANSTPITISTNTLVKARSWDGTAFVDAPSTWPWSALSEIMLVVDPAPLAITEIMYQPRLPSGAAELIYRTSDFEFIEIHNTSGSACSLVGVQFLDGVNFDFTFGNASTLAAGGYGVVVRNLDAFKVRYPDWASRNVLGTYTGRLSNRSENLELGYAPTNMLPLVSFDYEDDWYPSTDGEGFSLVLDDPQSDPATWDSKLAWRSSSSPDGSPGQANPASAHPQGTVVINEVLSHQDTDDPGDWIELLNTSAASIDIGGWFLSDSRGDLKKYAIPGGTQIPANGYVVFTEHDHFGSAFALSEHGDAVYLSAGSGGTLSVPAYREFQDFGGQERDVTFGRHLQSSGIADFPAMISPTLGAANSGPRVGPVVIEEIMYHPPTNGHEYIKIVNTSGAVVPLYDTLNPSNVWKVSGIDFEFSAGVQLTAEDSLLLVRDEMTPAQFRTAYAVPASIEIFNYSGALDNDTDTIVLKKPGAPESGTGFVPSIVVERVKYNDSDPWPVAADGGGAALRRISNVAYANDPANWQATHSTYTPILFALTVHAGSGDGTYVEGTVVSIQADPAPPNSVFVEWIGNVAGVANPQASFTPLTLPGQDVTLTALYASNAVFIATNAIWKYHDQGQDLGTAWRAVGYADTNWATGASQLGYGDSDEATVVDYGGVGTNKHPTTYFRKSFVVNGDPSLGNLALGLLRDDGAVAYLNGQAVLTNNMPAGPIDYQTLADSTVGGAAEDTYYPFVLSPSALVDGTNVLAVEVHQKALTSSDLSFAVYLEGVLTVEASLLDGDTDGMPDGWEMDHFGSTEAGLPGIDSDGDGVLNGDEAVAGTVPTDDTSFFRIEQVDATVFSWTPVTGRLYSVDWTDDLRQPFVEVASGLTLGSYAANPQTNASASYYRIRVELE